MKNKTQKPAVLIVGTFHMANPGLDYINTEVDDMLAGPRQEQIVELVRRLKTFKPTKVAIEAPFGAKKFNVQYRDYKAGRFPLSANEIHQVGFRLAKEMGHEEIYPVDVPGTLDFESVLSLAEQSGQMDVIHRFQELGAAFANEMNDVQANKSVVEIFRTMNSEGWIQKSHEAYMILAKIGKDSNYAGAEMVASWYARNLKIFSNIARIIESDEDRILVLFGSGHVKYLRDLFRESPDFELDVSEIP